MEARGYSKHIYLLVCRPAMNMRMKMDKPTIRCFCFSRRDPADRLRLLPNMDARILTRWPVALNMIFAAQHVTRGFSG